jgi:patatin-like phospholipase/acyl hydrolase
VARCPLHKSFEKPFEVASTAQLKPKYSGVRILTLDGGGVRGLVELKLLKAVESALGGKIPIQRFFDLIGGTSTGGLVALGLCTKNWTLTECDKHFPEICDAAFQKHGSASVGVHSLAYALHGCLYQHLPFEIKLKELLGNDRMLSSDVCIH